MYSSLMGNFDFMALVHHIYAMSSRLFHQRGLFLSALPILTILGPYLPQLRLVKVNLMSGMAMPLSIT
jgi:hypothetical protein